MADKLADSLLTGRSTLRQVAQEGGDGGTSPQDENTGPATPAPQVGADAIPEAKTPTVGKIPDSGRKFPCKACGAHLDFDPSMRALKCPYCGHIEEINPAGQAASAEASTAGGGTGRSKRGEGAIAELDFETYLHTQIGQTVALPGRSNEVKCPACGATVLLEDNVVTENCPFCATHLTNQPTQAAQSLIEPKGILPFAINDRQARVFFNQWIASRWFAPSNLKQMANLGQLSGIYLPFWTYDSMTYTAYTGQRGDDYWVTETYTDRDAQGRSVTRTRQVRRTRWTYVSGEVDHFFDDVLVCATRSLPEDYVNKLEPWDLKDLDGFQGAFLAGFRTERYTVSLGEGFAEAQQRMDGEIRKMCVDDIGGDHQQLMDVKTQHVGVTFKHILLPIWLAVYRYNNQPYRIMVNARTGEVVGSRPYSAVKIAFLTLAILALLLVVVYTVMGQRGQAVPMGY